MFAKRVNGSFLGNAVSTIPLQLPITKYVTIFFINKRQSQLKGSLHECNLVFTEAFRLILVQQIGDKFRPNRAICDERAKFLGNVGFNPLIEIGYGPITLLLNMAAFFKMAAEIQPLLKNN